MLEVTDISRPSDGKRADLIDNCVSIAAHDKGFAVVYLREADALLKVLGHGNHRLWERARETLAAAQGQLR